MRLGITRVVSLKRAVGPPGSLMSQSVCGVFDFSVSSKRLVKPRSAHASTIRLIVIALRGRYSELGSMRRSSSTRLNSCAEGYLPVVIIVRGGTSPEKWAANSSNASSPATSSSSGPTTVSSASRVLSSVRCTVCGAASPSSSASFCRNLRACLAALSPSFLSLWYICCRFILFLMPPTRSPAVPRPFAIVHGPGADDEAVRGGKDDAVRRPVEYGVRILRSLFGGKLLKPLYSPPSPSCRAR
mmetsp:Transcript_52623/g.112581  ORF Transcript_52623/g.112581 Transcript_52623/m.112581 type:complete len:243 (+) Transcript_52623:110-838(+)